MNKQTISQDQEAPPQPYLVSSVFSSTIYKTLGTRMAIPITPRESSHVLQNPTKMIFFCQEIFFSFKFTFFRTKDTRTPKRSFTFFLVFIFSFFSFFGFFIFHFLVSHLNRSPDRKVYVFWKEAITADLASSDSASFFEKVRLPFSIMVSPVKSVLLKNI